MPLFKWMCLSFPRCVPGTFQAPFPNQHRENTLMPWDKGLHSCVCDLWLPTKVPVCAGWMCISLSVGHISSNLVRKDKTERPKREVEVVILSWSTNILKSIEQEELDYFFPAPLLYIAQTQSWGKHSTKDEHQGGSIPCVGALSLSPKVAFECTWWLLAQQLALLFLTYLTSHSSPPVFDLCGWMWIWKSSSVLSAASCMHSPLPYSCRVSLSPFLSVFRLSPKIKHWFSAIWVSGRWKMNLHFSKIMQLKIPGPF